MLRSSFASCARGRKEIGELYMPEESDPDGNYIVGVHKPVRHSSSKFIFFSCGILLIAPHKALWCF